jgi:hypothetical protein
VLEIDDDELDDDIGNLDNMLDDIDIEPNSEESKEVDKIYYEGDWRKK